MSDIQYPSKVQMTSENYHANEAFGSTSLKKALRSVAHYKWQTENKTEPTKAMLFGTAFHLAALEPKVFKELAIVRPEFSGKGSVAAKEEWCGSNSHRLILSEEDMSAIKGMLKSVSAHTLASKLLADGAAEESYFWLDANTGLKCKCRPDFLRAGNIMADLKTTVDASLTAFQKTIHQYKYHLSAAHYLQGVSNVLGQAFETFLIIAVESDPPYAVQIFELDQATIEKGGELCTRALQRIKEYKDTGIVTAYSSDIVPVNLPPWGWSE